MPYLIILKSRYPKISMATTNFSAWILKPAIYKLFQNYFNIFDMVFKVVPYAEIRVSFQ